MDETFWQYWRHRNGFPLLKTAEVRVATHFVARWMGKDEEGELLWELRDVTWRKEFLEAILEHHMDVLFGATLLDEASVAERKATFALHCSWF